MSTLNVQNMKVHPRSLNFGEVETSVGTDPVPDAESLFEKSLAALRIHLEERQGVEYMGDPCVAHGNPQSVLAPMAFLTAFTYLLLERSLSTSTMSLSSSRSAFPSWSSMYLFPNPVVNIMSWLLP